MGGKPIRAGGVYGGDASEGAPGTSNAEQLVLCIIVLLAD
jgi:hypothetical protein